MSGSVEVVVISSEFLKHSPEVLELVLFFISSLKIVAHKWRTEFSSA